MTSVDSSFMCKVCPGKQFNSSTVFMSHLTSVHSAIEGGSYTCTYGDNKICNACPAVGISHTDYISHVNRHHMQTRFIQRDDRLILNSRPDTWTVYSSSVNLPAALNDPGKGKQKDFFTRSWGVDFVDSALLPSSPHICELPPHSFEKYLRKVRKYYSRHSKPGIVQQPHSGSPSPRSSRETTPSPGPKSPFHGDSSGIKTPTPPRPVPQKLDVPSVFLEQNFDLSNPTTFNTVFPFLQDTLNESTRLNPFQLDSGDVRQVEKSGKLAQEKLSHHLDQVEVSIAHQVAAKSHHFFQVMTYHDALMSQLIALINVVRTLRERLADVEKGVVLALKVPQLCLRKQNLGMVLNSLNILHTLHQTQPTIQVLLSRQEFAGALDLIATSQDIIKDDIGNVQALRHLPGQLGELMEIIGRMLLSDFKEIVNNELSREIQSVKGSCLGIVPRGKSNVSNTSNGGNATEGHKLDAGVENGSAEEAEFADCQVDECALSSIVSGLVRQNSFSFLEYFEEYGINAIKQVIKDVVLQILDLTEETTLTSLVAEFALIATPEGWTDLLDILVGSLIVSLRRMYVIYQTIISSLELKSNEDISEPLNCDNSAGQGEEVPRLKVKISANEVMINICDQVHERLGKLVTVRSRPNAVKLVTPEELSRVQNLIIILSEVTERICGKPSAGLQLSHQGQTILFIQHFHENARSRVASMLENEKWRKVSCSLSAVENLSPPLDQLVYPFVGGENDSTGHGIQELRLAGSVEPFTFVESLITFLGILSSYCSLLRDLPPSACHEVGLKIAELLKLFNSRTCQLVLGAGAVSLAGLKTITIRNLAVTLRSLAVVSQLIPHLRQNLMQIFPNITEKQTITLGRNFDHAAKDYTEHLGELERKVVQIVDATLQQQLGSWERKPPVPSNCFKSIGKQLLKFHEAIQDVLPPSQVSSLFREIHRQFLKRVAEKLKQSKLRPDNSPTHGLVVSELIFYRENLKYMNVLNPEDLIDSSLQTVWNL